MIEFIKQLQNTRFIGFAVLCLFATALLVAGYITGGEWVTSILGLYTAYVTGKTAQKFVGDSNVDSRITKKP